MINDTVIVMGVMWCSSQPRADSRGGREVLAADHRTRQGNQDARSGDKRKHDQCADRPDAQQAGLTEERSGAEGERDVLDHDDPLREAHPQCADGADPVAAVLNGSGTSTILSWRSWGNCPVQASRGQGAR